MKIAYPPGATPLDPRSSPRHFRSDLLSDPDEAAGLIPTSIATQAELNAFEQANIAEAEMWAMKKKRAACLTDGFIRQVHRRMLGQVWRWAGRYRTSDKNLGDPWAQLPERIGRLCGDVSFWIAERTYGWEELGARFHHRLVAIHPFANGNGRHARLMTDILLHAHDQKPFSWGSEHLGQPGEARARYLAALRAADERDHTPLIRFVRS